MRSQLEEMSELARRISSRKCGTIGEQGKEDLKLEIKCSYYTTVDYMEANSRVERTIQSY